MDSIDRSQFDISLTEIPRENTPTVSIESTLNDVIKEMQSSRSGALAVLKGETAIGLISERDLIQKIDHRDPDCFNRPVSDLMTAGPFSLPESSLVSDAMKMVTKRGFRHIPITDEDGAYKSMLSIKDILGFLIKFFPNHVTKYGMIREWSYQTVDDYSEAYTSDVDDYNQVNGNIFLAHLKRVAHKRPVLVDHNADIGEVIDIMRMNKSGTVLLMRYETELRGVLTERDLLLKVFAKEKMTDDLLANQFMTAGPDTLLQKHYIAHAINNMFHYKYRNTIIVNEDKFPLSVVSLLEIFKFVAHHFYGDELSLL